MIVTLNDERGTKLANKRYYEVLLEGMKDSDLTVKRIVHGISWTAAELSNGNAGVAMHTEGESRHRQMDDLTGLNIQTAAESVLSWNMEEANEGMAVINAFYNTTENRAAHETDSGQRLRDKGALAGLELTDKKVVFVGHLVGHSGITEELLQPCREWHVLEREPKEGDYPDSACEFLIPDSDIVVITGSASMNKTMPRLLELARKATVVLAGPSVPMCPNLFSLGVDRLYGSIIEDKEGCFRGIVEKKGSVNPYSTRFCVDQEDLWQAI